MACVFMRKFRPSCKSRERILRLCQRQTKIGLRTCATEAAEPIIKSQGEVTVKLSNGNTLSFSSGKLARLADGCAQVTYQNTSVMATVVSKENKKTTETFVPLMVSYQQKAAALGRIPLNYHRRELGLSETEVLTSRLIDRSVRPLFPQEFNWDTQIICNPFAMDGSNFPDVLGINAASAALAVSDVPWEGPVGAVRIGLVKGETVVNPTKSQLMDSELNLVMTTRSNDVIMMLEGAASNINTSDLFKCLDVGVKECNRVIDGILALQENVGKKKRTFSPIPVNPELQSAVESLSVETLRAIFLDRTHNKLSRDEAVNKLQSEVLQKVKEDFKEESPDVMRNVFLKTCKNAFRDLIFETEIRCDGRRLWELRDISCEVNLFEPLHGSALFQRGQTQVLCKVTLDSPMSALKLDRISMMISGVKDKNFFVHYEFPPFATNETGRIGPVGRREIGHGILAEKALRSNIPDNFPFTIRLTSEVLESNGSSSMATVCGGTLALWDAGVPLKNPCAGVAMGFISRSNREGKISEYKILTDLMGIEDFFGEMDFKVAGNKEAFTAFQMDVKNRGIPIEIVLEILEGAKKSIGEILEIMSKTCSQVRTERKSCWPEKTTIKVPIHRRSAFLGPGGASIRKLELTTGVEFTEDKLGEFSVFAPSAEALEEAKEMIADVLEESEEVKLEFGGVYSAQIVELRERGCMVTLYPNMKPAFIHVSQLDVRQVKHPSALGLEVGQEIAVKYFGRDPASGSMRLSRKVLLGPASEGLISRPGEDLSGSVEQIASADFLRHFGK